ncbi:myosin binding protein Ha isoform X4 [Girardinichthys multiradiatus]|uniref:myosin binding protein Ha isoform X4 n=1 Tax=Girardinichthys multiradiatus TaxID=208333 RepID=UPI001FAE7082|nr:myosin binding protein Ha isoform X4 [Girardinichthys multiradiatus]
MPSKPAPMKKSPAKKAVENAPEPAPEPRPAPPAEAPPAEAPAEEATSAVPAEETPTTGEAAPAAAPIAEDSPALPDADAPIEAAPAEAALIEEPQKAPTPPPPAVPSSAPLNVSVDDVNDSSLTIKWKTPETVGSSGLSGYTVEYRKDGNKPKVRLPRSLRSRYVKKVGEQINLVVPFIGKPKPAVSWLKDGQPVDTKRVNIRNSDRDSILFIRSAQREDSGIYEMTVKVESFEDKAALAIQTVDLPGPPSSVKLVDAWGFNAALEWTPPKDNGNSDITGYTVQKADKKTGEWFTVLEHYHRLTATVSDLIMGNSYLFRVFSENQVGRSESSAVTKKVATIQKTGIVYKPPEYQEHDFSEAPKFTTPLIDRAATVGYTTKLLCSVRGCPKPKIEWLKNQMIIGNDPKFRQISNQGICSLEIRKPCSFDGGVYTCRAKNAQGEAVVSCKLEVKQVILPEADKEKGK